MNEFYKTVEAIERVDNHISKLGIFKYDTLDEANPKRERIRGDVTIEIGGPSTHIKFGILTRDEHSIIKAAVEKILFDRKDCAEAKLDRLCAERVRAGI